MSHGQNLNLHRSFPWSYGAVIVMPALTPLSQGFDRTSRPWGRSWNPDWKLSGMKAIFNEWNVDMPKFGGWNSN